MRGLGKDPTCHTPGLQGHCAEATPEALRDFGCLQSRRRIWSLPVKPFCHLAPSSRLAFVAEMQSEAGTWATMAEPIQPLFSPRPRSALCPGGVETPESLRLPHGRLQNLLENDSSYNIV